MPALLGRDYIDFDEHIFWEARDFYCRASGRSGAEVLPVDLVHLRKVVHAFQEDSAADYLAKAAACGLQDLRKIPQNAVCLGSDVARDDLLGCGIDRDLPGGENEPIRFDSLRVRADGLWIVFGRDDFAHKN